MCLPCPPSIFYDRFSFRLIVGFRFEAPVVRSNSAGIYNLWNQNICDYSLNRLLKITFYTVFVFAVQTDTTFLESLLKENPSI